MLTRPPRTRRQRPLQVIILKGLPGSGKSTWAKDLVHRARGHFKRINKDDLRAMIDAGEWSPRNETFIVRVRDQLLVAALAAGFSVIVDDTNFEPAHEKRIRELAAGRAEVSVRMFDVPLEECIRRDALRPFPVGETVIREMARDWLGIPLPGHGEPQ
jgi:predicted kinase